MSLNINSEKIIDPNLIRNQSTSTTALNAEAMGPQPHPQTKKIQQITAATQRNPEAIFLSSIQRYE